MRSESGKPSRLALATYDQAPGLLPEDLHLQSVLATLGIDAVATVWDAPEVDWSQFDAVLIRSTWDYFRKFPAWLAWLAQLDKLGVPTLNPLPVLRWNSDKRYLAELAGQGIAIPATEKLAGAQLASVAQRPGEWIVKPAVSGGAWHTVRGTGGDPAFVQALAALPTAMDFLVQPFLPEVAEAGEWSLLYFGGQYSHAVLKQPAHGEFRVQSQFGGTTTALAPPAPARAAAQQVLSLVEQKLATRLTYARVDGVMVDGSFLLMELEVIEPFLFLEQHALATGMLARAVASALGQG